MPALATITINDGAATPVAHAFTPRKSDGVVATLKESLGIPEAFPDLKLSVREPVKGSPVWRLRFSLALPVTAVVDGVTVVDHVNDFDGTFRISARSLEQARKDLRVMVANLFGNAAVITAIEKLEGFY